MSSGLADGALGSLQGASDVIAAVQWAPSGNALEGIPGQVMRLLATPEGKTFGYGYGSGVTIIFGSENGDVEVNPKDWVVKHRDRSITVQDYEPQLVGDRA